MNKELEDAAEWFSDDEPSCDYEAGIKTGKYQGFIEGTKWQAKKMYSEEDMREALFHSLYAPKTDGYIEKTIDEIVRETIAKFKNK